MGRLDSLTAFVAVAGQERFAAARPLNRSVAAVMLAIAALRDMLQVRLFNRSTRAVTLTDTGARVLDRARRLPGEFEEFDTTTEDSDTLRCTIGMGAQPWWMQSWISRCV